MRGDQGEVVVNECQIRADLLSCLGRLWRFGVVLSGDGTIAEKLVEQTCIRALAGEHPLLCTKRKDCWLFSVLHSVWTDGHRSQRYKARHYRNATTPFGGTRGSQSPELVAQVANLPDTVRASVFLAYVEGMAHREVAEVLALPVDTVRNNLAAARRTLAKSARGYETRELKII